MLTSPECDITHQIIRESWNTFCWINCEKKSLKTLGLCVCLHQRETRKRWVAYIEKENALSNLAGRRAYFVPPESLLVWSVLKGSIAFLRYDGSKNVSGKKRNVDQLSRNRLFWGNTSFLVEWKSAKIAPDNDRSTIFRVLWDFETNLFDLCGTHCILSFPLVEIDVLMNNLTVAVTVSVFVSVAGIIQVGNVNTLGESVHWAQLSRRWLASPSSATQPIVTLAVKTKWWFKITLQMCFLVWYPADSSKPVTNGLMIQMCGGETGPEGWLYHQQVRAPGPPWLCSKQPVVRQFPVDNHKTSTIWE